MFSDRKGLQMKKTWILPFVISIITAGCGINSTDTDISSNEKLIYRDSNISVYFEAVKERHDMNIKMHIGQYVFEHVWGAEPYYKQTDRGIMFFMHGYDASGINMQYLCFFKDGKLKKYAPTKERYFFRPDEDEFTFTGDTLIIKGSKQNIILIFDLKNTEIE